MIKALFFDPITGASGDMILGALLDLGVPLKVVENAIRSAGLEEFEIEFNRVTDHTGITAGRCDVKIEESHHHRHLKDIEKIIDTGEFSEYIKATAKAIFRRLAEAEAKVHNTSVEKVHFHEVGAVDAIVDILGSAIAIDYLKPEKIYCAPFKTGRGTVKCAHGEMPVPAPATVELIRGFPTVNLPIDMELTTPTGAAVLTTLSDGDITGHSFVIKNVGYGIGSRKLEGRINGLRVMEIVLDEQSSREVVDIIETDIDDENPEVIAALMDELRTKGVCDVTLEQIQMKKGRPGFRLTVVAPRGADHEIANILFSHSSTIGARSYEAKRFILPREAVTVSTRWGDVAAKKIHRPNGVEIAPEYDSCKQIAAANGVSIREVMQEVRYNARQNPS